ncbi:YIP1 family protein [bacterium]|nr:YIP1 family protein [bacterium]
MPLNLALFQAESVLGQPLYIILGVITLATLVALGLRFFINMFEVITAPGASLSHHGQNDNFFFSIFVVFLGGLIGTFGLLATQSLLTGSFHNIAVSLCNSAALLNSNANYRDIAAQYGISVMDGNFDIYVTSNLVFFPILMVVLWILVGSICFVASKVFGGQGSYGNFLSGLAYAAFFYSIGLAFAMPDSLAAYSASLEMVTASPSVLGIIGSILMLYGIVLFIMGISQGADMAGGQVIGVVVVLLVVLGGLSYLGYYYATPIWQEFTNSIQSYNPA